MSISQCNFPIVDFLRVSGRTRALGLESRCMHRASGAESAQLLATRCHPESDEEPAPFASLRASSEPVEVISLCHPEKPGSRISSFDPLVIPAPQSFPRRRGPLNLKSKIQNRFVPSPFSFALLAFFQFIIRNIISSISLSSQFLPPPSHPPLSAYS